MKIKDICIDRLRSKNLAEDDRYKKRLSWELKEIENQDKENYFLDLLARKVTYSENQNNLLVPYLLDIVKDFYIDQDPAFFYGDFPDVDSDYLPAVRDFLKNEWAPKTFGEQYVCNIGNYTTFGIKSSLIDMVRVHGESRDQILALTTNLQTKDDEGKVLTWESAMRTDPLLNKYCEEHPEIAKAAQKLIDRNRGMGVHAGGLIVSSIPLTDLVPLVKRKDSPQASAWVEGLHGQDLQPVGLVKFDLLVISNLLQIAYCCKLINDRHGIDKICAQPGQGNWSNTEEYRNNPESLAMADEGDLKCIFQFDSPGIRSLAKAGGVTKFEDLVAYSSLYRPGPLNMKMHDRYVERKRGREEYKLHPILDEILNDTYGVIVYQEQVMKILNIVGNIPMRDVETVRKAISKKKVEQFIKYKEIFIRNGKKTLDQAEDELENLWNTIESFAEYGFNKSHACAYTHISARLLYLKSHFPHEFYTAILMCESDTDKIKDYRREAIKHGVNLRKIDVNLSKENFSLVGDEIYFGLSNVKGIGEPIAKEIIKGQPYKDFEDFVERFGTDASVLKPLLALRCFSEAEPYKLLMFAEKYKDYVKKNQDRKKRFHNNNKKNKEILLELIENAENSEFIKNKVANKELDNIDIDELKKVNSKTCDEWKKRYSGLLVDGKDAWKQICKMIRKMQSAKERYYSKEDMIKPKLSEFVVDENKQDKLKEEFEDLVACEKKYYGFTWQSNVEKSPDYKGGLTFDRLEPDTTEAMPVEIEVISVQKKKGKKTEYYQLKAEDANCDEGVINVWKDDYANFQNELQAGNFLRIRLSPPSKGFKTFTIESVGPRNFYKKTTVNKEDDYRIVVLRKKEQNNDAGS
jgi:DNA polymerase III alpha subunit